VRHRFVTIAFVIAVVSLAHAQFPVAPFRGTPERFGTNFQAIGAWFNSCGRIEDTPLQSTGEIGGITKLVSSPTAALNVEAKTSGYCAPESTDQGQSYIYQGSSRELDGPGLNWNAEARIASIPVASADAPFFVIFSLADSSNFSYAAIYPAAANPDVYFGKIVAGVNTNIQSANVDIGPESIIRLEMRSTTGTLFDDDVQVLTATDATFDDGANSSESWAIGWGAIRSLTDSAHAVFAIDWFKFSKVNIGAPVDVGPTVDITSPVSPFATAASSVEISGTVAEGTSAIASVTVTCTGVNAVTNQAATVTSGTWSYVLTLTNLGDSSCVATATDAAALTDPSASVTISKVTAADNSDPSCTWISPASTPFASSTSSITVSLQCTDNVAVTSATWANAGTSGSGTCSFVSGPSATVACGPFVLAAGGVNNVVTATVADAAGNDAQFTRTITYIADLTIPTTSPLPNLVEDQAGQSRCITAAGGVSPFTWSVTAGALPTGMSLNGSTTATVCITGTPTTSQTVTPTIQVVDSQGSPDSASKQFSITVAAAGAETFETYYLMMKARGDRLFANALRNQSGEATVASMRSNCGTTWPCSTTYDYVNDTYAKKQDAMRVQFLRGQASASGHLRAPLPDNGFAGQSVFVTVDFWEGDEWGNVADHKIYNHKQTPLYFFWGSSNAVFGLWQGYQEGSQNTQTQPPGGPYTSFLWNHATTTQPRPPLSWRDGRDNGFPRVRLPYNVASGVQRSYTEAIASASSFGPTVWTNPMPDDQTSVGGAAAGAGQEPGIIGNRWHRAFYLFERRADEDYICSITTECASEQWTKAAYDVSMWLADTVRGPIQVLDKVKIGLTIYNGQTTSYVNLIRIENSCGNQCDGPNEATGVIRDTMYKYYRHLVVLRGNHLTVAEITPLLQKPVP
jgi:hypothetical protein